MTYNFGDESIHIHNMAKNANSASDPYDYDKEILMENEFSFSNNTRLGITRTESLDIAASVVGALMIFGSFIHADKVKDGISEVPEQIIEVITAPTEFINDVTVFFMNMRI